MKSNKSRSFFLIDLFILNISFFGYLAYVMSRGLAFFSFEHVISIIILSFIWFFISANTSLHILNAGTQILKSIKTLFMAYSCLAFLLIIILATLGNLKDNYKIFLIPMLYSGIAFLITRFIFLVTVKYFSKNGFSRKKALVIGGGRVAEKVIRRIMKQPYLGYKLYGFISNKYHESLPNHLYKGNLSDFSDVVRSVDIDEVIIALPLRHEKEIIEIVSKCNYEGIRLRIVPDFFRIVENKMEISSLDDIPLISIQTEPLNALGNRVQKRIFDIVFSVSTMILFSPIFFLTAAAVKITSPGPVIFKQKRVGANNKEFTIYKFRSMRVQSKKKSDCTWTTPEDSRVTKIGNFLRSTNLDELPQFWNVLKGDMSIVGPRPERGHFVEQFKDQITNYKVRHLIKPGITGWAQVNGYRGDTSIPERIKHDIFYLQHWSIWFDVKIIFFTLFNRSAYENAY